MPVRCFRHGTLAVAAIVSKATKQDREWGDFRGEVVRSMESDDPVLDHFRCSLLKIPDWS